MKKLALALVALGAAVSSQAAVVSYQYGVPVVTTTTEINQNGSLGLFNSNLGTLTGATLDVFGTGIFSFTGTNSAQQGQIARLTASTDLFWSSSLASLSPFLALDRLSMSATSGNQTYGVGQSQSFGPFTDSKTASNDLSSILASLQTAGGGNFNLNCQSLSGLLVQGGGGNIGTTQTTQAGCGAKISYVYTAVPTTTVPEPGSLALMGLALAGVAVSARRRRQS